MWEQAFQPASQDELLSYLAKNDAGERHPLCCIGGQTSLGSGYPLPAQTRPIDTRRLNKVLDYPARDMTITVQAGLSISELMEILAKEGQQLPIDIAFPNQATLGGAIASNAFGPRRYHYGTFRDYVIGVSAVTADGSLFRSGGRVVKNVAGYDLCKLLIGSRGTLAVITEVTLKLKPVTQCHRLLACSMPEVDELDLLLEVLAHSNARPVSLDIVDGSLPQLESLRLDQAPGSNTATLFVGFAGRPDVVDWEMKQLQSEIASFGPDVAVFEESGMAQRMWNALTEFGSPPARDSHQIQIVASMPPSATVEYLAIPRSFGASSLAHAADGIVISTIRQELTLEEFRTIHGRLTAFLNKVSGRLVISACPNDWKDDLPIWGNWQPSWGLMQRIKRVLDPHQIFNPGHGVDGVEAPSPNEMGEF